MIADKSDWDWLEGRLADLRRGDRGQALHKPLLLLLALSRTHRWHRFADLEHDLATLLVEFGRTTRPEPHLPFWHLQSDDGVWTVKLSEPDDLVYRAGKQRPTRTSLRLSQATGGLGDRVWRLVGHRSEARKRMALMLTTLYFEHEATDVLRALRLD